MNFEIRQYNGLNKADFYIQCKGLHSGRPLDNPIPNCFGVKSADDLLKEKVYALFVARIFEPIIGGSVIPFIRIYETRHLLNEHLDKFNNVHEKKLIQIRQIDKLMEFQRQQIKTYSQLQKALVFSIIK